MLPSSKQATADGIYAFHRSVSVKLIAYLLIFEAGSSFFSPNVITLCRNQQPIKSEQITG